MKCRRVFPGGAEMQNRIDIKDHKFKTSNCLLHFNKTARIWQTIINFWQHQLIKNTLQFFLQA